MKIIHITEAMGAGVAHVMSQLAKAQAADGHDVTVVYAVRPDTPVALLPTLFPVPIRLKLVPMVTEVAPLADMRSLMRLYRLLRLEAPDVIHLHSSKAGFLGRLAAFALGKRHRVFYSPHAFAFLREDVSPGRRQLFLNLERFGSKLGGTLIGCSQTEVELARQQVGHKRTVLVENSVDFGEVLPTIGATDGRVRVVTSGRICYQKAPWRFKSLARGCSDLPVDFVWIGDGDLRQELMTEGVLPENVRVTSWLSRGGVYTELAAADIFVLPSLWEGMPLALIEAQAAGLPAVVYDVAGNRDVVIEGQTGFVCQTDAQFLQRTRQLIEDPVLRDSMGQAAREMASQRFAVERMCRIVNAVYGFSDIPC